MVFWFWNYVLQIGIFLLFLEIQEQVSHWSIASWSEVFCANRDCSYRFSFREWSSVYDLWRFLAKMNRPRKLSSTTCFPWFKVVISDIIILIYHGSVRIQRLLLGTISCLKIASNYYIARFPSTNHNCYTLQNYSFKDPHVTSHQSRICRGVKIFEAGNSN